MKSCPAFLLRGAALLLILSASLPLSLRAQVDSTGPSLVHVDSTNSAKVEADRRQNFWLSAGIGAGLHGLAVTGGAWYSNNHLVVGAHAAEVTALWGPEVHDFALLLGVRNLKPNSMLMIAAGPAVLGGKLYVGNLYQPRTVANYEAGFAASALATVNFSEVGIGFNGFVAQSGNRLVEGVTLSIQAGWLGN
ncbi:MAG: hypothetical protein ACXU9Z_16560 [Gemmatimonadaceae bacterium]